METAWKRVWDTINREEVSADELEEQLLLFSEYYADLEEDRENHRRLLEKCFELQRTDLLQTVLQVLQDTNPQEAVYSTLSYILTLGLTNDCVVYIGEVIEFNYFETVEGMMDITQEDYLASGLRNVDLIFGNRVNEEDIRSLIAVSLDHDPIHQMLEYLEDKLQALSTEEVVELPDWVIPFDLMTQYGSQPVSHDYLMSQLSDDVPKSVYVSVSPEADVDYLLVNHFINPTAMDADPEVFREQYVMGFSKLGQADRTAKVRWMENNCRQMLLAIEDVEAFGILGPCLMQPGAINLKKRSNDVCRLMGGCRWYTCYENENVDEFTGENLVDNVVELQQYAAVEWYTGKCETCSVIIPYKHWAVRKPMPAGGWKGCYHDWKCAKLSIDEDDVVARELLKKYKKLVLSVGIYDRTHE
jgi:hypothetical protein